MPLMIYCTAASTSFSDSVSCITFLFSEWRVSVLVILRQERPETLEIECISHSANKVYAESRKQVIEVVFCW